MDYTNCVFGSEANARVEVKRDDLIKRFGLEGKVEAGKPILFYIIEVLNRLILEIQRRWTFSSFSTQITCSSSRS